MGGTTSCSSTKNGDFPINRQLASAFCHNYEGDGEVTFSSPANKTSVLRFSAEVFKLSDDRSRWLKVGPSALSITVNRCTSEVNGRALLLDLNAVDLQLPDKNVITLPITADTKFRRYSSRFVYWMNNDSSDVYGLNVMSEKDADQLCQLTIDEQPTAFAGIGRANSQRKSKNLSLIRVDIHIAQLFSIKNRIIFENIVLTFTKAFLEFNAPNTLRVLGENEKHIYVVEASECVISSDYARLILYLSFTTHAFCVQFIRADDFRRFCFQMLNSSSAVLVDENPCGIHKTGKDSVLVALQSSLEAVDALVRELFQAISSNKLVDVNVGTPSARSTIVEAGNENKQNHNHYRFCRFFDYENAPSNATSAVDTLKSACDRNNNLGVQPFVEVLCLLNYVLIVRTSALRNLIPHSDFSSDVVLEQIRQRFYNLSSPSQHLIHYIHLNAILHSSFSVKKSLQLVTSKSTCQQCSAADSQTLTSEIKQLKLEGSTGGHEKASDRKQFDLMTFQCCQPTQKSNDIDSTHYAEENDFSHSIACENPGDILLNSVNGGCKTQKKKSGENIFNVVMELLVSEQTFVNDLETLIDKYLRIAELRPLRQIVDEVLRIHENFLASLRDACQLDEFVRKSAQDVDLLTIFFERQSNQSRVKDIILRISALFINKCDKFKVYSDYSAAYLQFQRIQKKNHQLYQTLCRMNLSGQLSESFESYLIKPIQRILKYPLFLQQICDSCDVAPSIIEKQQAVNALKKMETLANYVNEMMRIQEEYGAQLERVLQRNKVINSESGAILRDLLMFAQLKLLKPKVNNSSSSSLRSTFPCPINLVLGFDVKSSDVELVDCVAFVFKFFILIMQKSAGDDEKSSESKLQNKAVDKLHVDDTDPYVLLPMWRINFINDENVVYFQMLFENLLKAKRITSNYEYNHYLLIGSAGDSAGESGSGGYGQVLAQTTVYHLICCHVDIKEHFIRSIRKGQKLCVKHKMLRPDSISSQSDYGYSSSSGR